jgi:hypothetical protein
MPKLTLAPLPFILALTSVPTEAADVEAPPIEITYVPTLCETVTPSTKSRVQLIVQSAQTWPSYQLVVGSARYVIGLEKNRVRYIGVSDPKFKTSEGLSVASTFAEVLQASPDKGSNEPGWAYFVPLRSGWSAAFKASAPTKAQLVSWFFKRCEGYGKCSCGSEAVQQ